MKSQSSLGKALEINKDSRIYGTFAEIGAGQETVHFFYKAGLASHTVAKSMSAYDMTVSDEIYGKQSRYVSKERLMTMLQREYNLMERRLKKKIGRKTRFFAFSVTAATSSHKGKNSSFSSHHAWMGLRFQSKSLEAFNDITFHVNCLDPSRLQQHEALGILGVNLIYAAFYCRSNPKKLISSLVENLSGGRVEIHDLSCSGPAFKKFSSPLINLEILSQNLSSMAFFPCKEYSVFLSDAIFNKHPVVLFGDQSLVKKFKEKKSRFFKQLSLTGEQTALMASASKSQFQASTFQNRLKELCKNGCSTLITQRDSMEELRELISPHTSQPIVFVVSEKYFKNTMFKAGSKGKSILKSLGALFDKKTRLAVLSESKNFSVKKYKMSDPQAELLKNYLNMKKQILDLKFL